MLNRVDYNHEGGRDNSIIPEKKKPHLMSGVLTVKLLAACAS
jgi:hypothetical protein